MDLQLVRIKQLDDIKGILTSDPTLKSLDLTGKDDRSWYEGEVKRCLKNCVEMTPANYRQIFDYLDSISLALGINANIRLFKAKDSVLYMVNPAEKTFSQLPMNAIFQMTGVAGKLIKIKIKNPVLNNEKLGTAMVLGYPCQHSKQLMEYDMEVKVVFIKSKSHVKIEKEVWSTPKIKAMAEMAESFRFRDFKTGMEDLDNLIEEQMKADAEMGFPLKMITVNTSIDKKGNAKEASRQTMEVLSVGSKTFPASFFEIPSGYEEKQIGFGKDEE